MESDGLTGSQARPPRARQHVLTLLFLLPLALYGLTLGRPVLRDGTVVLGRLDLVVFIMVLTYAAAAIAALVTARRSAQFRLLLLVYASLVTVLLLELPLRVLYPEPPERVPWRPVRLISTAGKAMPGIEGPIEFSVNSLGLRGPEVRLASVPTRILAVGGSTTECLYVTDKLSWPWLLQDKLTSRLGQPVFVGNAGKSGLFTLHHEYLLANYPLAPDFNHVLVMVGINDMGSFLRGSYDRRRLTVAAETLTPAHEARALYRRLTLFRWLDRREMIATAGATVAQDPHGNWYDDVRRQRRAMLERRTIDQPPKDLQTGLDTYAENLRRIVQLTARRNQKLILITQPTLYRADLPPDLEQLLWAALPDGAYTAAALEIIMKAYNRTLLDVCRAEGVECLDLASMLPQDTSVFYDDAHFNTSGSERVATILADLLGPKLGAR